MQNLGDIRTWCENNKGSCAGLISVSILLILVISSGKSCGKFIFRLIFYGSLLVRFWGNYTINTEFRFLF